jgi:hypothetical protein
MNFFNRRFERYKDETAEKEKIESDLKRLRSENLGKSDTIAILIAVFQMILPYVIGIAIIYFLIIQFITKIWLR